MTQEAKELAERLRSVTVDWDGSQMDDGEPPRDVLRCRDLRLAADELDRLATELEWIAKLPTRKVNGGIEVAYDVFNGGAAILRARAALQGSPPEGDSKSS